MHPKQTIIQDQLQKTIFHGEFPKAINHPSEEGKSFLVKSAKEEEDLLKSFGASAPAARRGRPAKSEQPAESEE